MVTVWNNEEFPADIMLVNCPGEAALIDTTNIDGEIMVKEKYPFVPDYNPDKHQFFNGVIKCQEPTGLGFDDWTSSIKYDAKNYKVLSSRNMCLRGSILRSTDFAVGIVIYVGMDSKIYADRKAPERKKSWLLE